jgi:hypothetical protein
MSLSFSRVVQDLPEGLRSQFAGRVPRSTVTFLFFLSSDATAASKRVLFFSFSTFPLALEVLLA